MYSVQLSKSGKYTSGKKVALNTLILSCLRHNCLTLIVAPNTLILCNVALNTLIFCKVEAGASILPDWNRFFQIITLLFYSVFAMLCLLSLWQIHMMMMFVTKRLCIVGILRKHQDNHEHARCQQYNIKHLFPFCVICTYISWWFELTGRIQNQKNECHM